MARITAVAVAFALVAIGAASVAQQASDPHENPIVQNSPAGKKEPENLKVPAAGKKPTRGKSKTAAVPKAAPPTIAPKALNPEQAILGTWELVLEKSHFNPGPAPRSETRTYTRLEGGVQATVTTVAADGVVRTMTYPWQLDGKEHAVSGSPLLDTIRLESVDNLTSRATLIHAGVVLASETRQFSADGSTMSIAVKDKTSADRPIEATAVYERK